MTSHLNQQAGERFLVRARQEFADGDLARATEKSWGATAQMLKAIAEQRGWEHHRHHHYHRAASCLRAETGDGDIRRLFDSASALHGNFYEDDMAVDKVAERLGDVEALVDRFLPLLTQT